MSEKRDKLIPNELAKARAYLATLGYNLGYKQVRAVIKAYLLAQLAKVKQPYERRVAIVGDNTGRKLAKAVVKAVGQKKLDRPEAREWEKHFGEEMAKLPPGTPCCGNCVHHRPSVMWHAVTCTEHRGDFAEDILGCLCGGRASGNLWEPMGKLDRPDREKILPELEKEDV